MSADWEVGDLALCVKMGPWRGGRDLELRRAICRAGGVYQVRAVGTWEGLTILWFEGEGGSSIDDSYLAFNFRKVTPLEADEFDRETIELMNRKPVEAVR